MKNARDKRCIYSRYIATFSWPKNKTIKFFQWKLLFRWQIFMLIISLKPRSKIYKLKWKILNPLKKSGQNMEKSQFICRANQMTSFYIIKNLAFKKIAKTGQMTVYSRFFPFLMILQICIFKVTFTWATIVARSWFIEPKFPW